MNESDLLSQIDQTCRKYVEAWRSQRNHYIKALPDTYIEGAMTPFEEEYLVLALLRRSGASLSLARLPATHGGCLRLLLFAGQSGGKGDAGRATVPAGPRLPISPSRRHCAP